MTRSRPSSGCEALRTTLARLVDDGQPGDRADVLRGTARCARDTSRPAPINCSSPTPRGADSLRPLLQHDHRNPVQDGIERLAALLTRQATEPLDSQVELIRLGSTLEQSQQALAWRTEHVDLRCGAVVARHHAMRDPGGNHRCVTDPQPPRLVVERDVELPVHDDEYLFLFVCMQRGLRPCFVPGEADHQATSQQRLQNQSHRNVQLGKLGNRHEPARERGLSSVGRRAEVGIRLYRRSLLGPLQDAVDATASCGSEWPCGRYASDAPSPCRTVARIS